MLKMEDVSKSAIQDFIESACDEVGIKRGVLSQEEEVVARYAIMLISGFLQAFEEHMHKLELYNEAYCESPASEEDKDNERERLSLLKLVISEFTEAIK